MKRSKLLQTMLMLTLVTALIGNILLPGRVYAADRTTSNTAEFVRQILSEAAPLLRLPPEERTQQSLAGLLEMELISPDEYAELSAIAAMDDGSAMWEQAKSVYQDGAPGDVATAILLTTIGLGAPPTAPEDIEACEAAFGEQSASGFWNWLGGLVKAVFDGAVAGAFLGGKLGALVGRPGLGAVIGGVAGGIGGAIGYLSSGVMANPDGSDCQPPFLPWG